MADLSAKTIKTLLLLLLVLLVRKLRCGDVVGRCQDPVGTAFVMLASVTCSVTDQIKLHTRRCLSI